MELQQNNPPKALNLIAVNLGSGFTNETNLLDVAAYFAKGGSKTVININDMCLTGLKDYLNNYTGNDVLIINHPIPEPAPVESLDDFGAAFRLAREQGTKLSDMIFPFARDNESIMVYMVGRIPEAANFINDKLYTVSPEGNLVLSRSRDVGENEAVLSKEPLLTLIPTEINI